MSKLALHGRYKVTETLSCVAIRKSTDELQAHKLEGLNLTKSRFVKDEINYHFFPLL